MPAIARNGSSIATTTVNNHVPIRKWIPPYSCGTAEFPQTCGGYYEFDTASATIDGKVSQSSGSVYVNGVRMTVSGATTNETETHNIPSGWEAYDQHYSGSGKVTSGNNKNVFVNGVSVAMVGSTVRTHAGNSTTVSSGSPNVFIGG